MRGGSLVSTPESFPAVGEGGGTTTVAGDGDAGGSGNAPPNETSSVDSTALRSSPACSNSLLISSESARSESKGMN